MNKLAEIQSKLKAPKNQYNNFGKYKYRSCEDILEAVKPLLGEAILTINDEIVLIGDRYYVKATATIREGKESVSTTAYAREAVTKKGMDEAQVTGATSSYARKYALNGLFLIDDTKDADTQDNTQIDLEKIKAEVEKINDIDELREYYKSHQGMGKEVSEMITARSKYLTEIPVV
jgi:hypothetical protein